MSVYQISGPTLSLTGNGTVNGGNIAYANTVNPVTGSIGLSTVRVVNTSAANVAAFTYTPSYTTYAFANVSGTTSGNGANATFNVVVANSGYQVALNAGGTTYANTDTVTIVGSALGGANTTNDLTLTVTGVSNTGAITSFTEAGTVKWPQSTVGSISILPRGEEFIQVTNVAGSGSYFSANVGDGNVLVTPVNVIK